MLKFEELKSIIEKINCNQANYQPVTIKHLLESDELSDFKKSIAEKLALSNGKKVNDYSFFMACPVFKVLHGKGVIPEKSPADKIIRLNADLTKSERSELIKICDARLNC